MIKDFLNHLKYEIANNTKSPFTFSLVILIVILKPLKILLYRSYDGFSPAEKDVFIDALDLITLVFVFLVIRYIFKIFKKDA